MTDPSAEIDYYLRAHMAATAFRPSPEDYVRLMGVIGRLRRAGVAGDDARIPQWLAPILCRNAEEQRRFHTLCRMTETEPPAQTVGQTATHAQNGALKKLRLIGWSFACGLGLLLALLPTRLLDGSVPNLTLNKPIDENPSLLPTPAPIIHTVVNWSAIAAMVVVTLTLVIGYLVWQRRRRDHLRSLAKPQPISLDDATPGARRPEWIKQGENARDAEMALSQPDRVPGRRLDARTTVQATVRAGGLPSLRFRPDLRAPDYLLLVDRVCSQDHISLIGAAMYAWFNKMEIAVRLYTFQSTPDRLTSDDDADDTDSLETVLGQWPRARIVLIAEAYDLDDGHSDSEWRRAVTSHEGRIVYIDPRPQAQWGSSEERLSRAGWLTLACGHMMSRPALLAVGKEPRGSAGGSRYDLPEGLARVRSRMLDDAPPVSGFVTSLVGDLKAWLSETGFTWLAATAIYPFVDPVWTGFVGARLLNLTSRDPAYLDMARLVWLRAGYMPNWLREALIRSLPKAVLKAVGDLLAEFLKAADDGKTTGARRRLFDQLTVSPESHFHDRILLDALQGRQPPALAINQSWRSIMNHPERWAFLSRNAADNWFRRVDHLVQPAMLTATVILAVGIVVTLAPPILRTVTYPPDEHTQTSQDPSMSIEPSASAAAESTAGSPTPPPVQPVAVPARNIPPDAANFTVNGPYFRVIRDSAPLLDSPSRNGVNPSTNIHLKIGQIVRGENADPFKGTFDVQAIVEGKLLAGFVPTDYLSPITTPSDKETKATRQFGNLALKAQRYFSVDMLDDNGKGDMDEADAYSQSIAKFCISNTQNSDIRNIRYLIKLTTKYKRNVSERKDSDAFWNNAVKDFIEQYLNNSNNQISTSVEYDAQISGRIELTADVYIYGISHQP